MYTCPASSTPIVDIINIPSVSPDITGLSGPVHLLTKLTLISLIDDKQTRIAVESSVTVSLVKVRV